MKFYKENHINSASSCLPILAQIPVFIGALLRAPRLRGRVLPPTRRRASSGSASSTSPRTRRTGWGPLLIVVYAVSQLTSTYLMSTTMQPAQRVLMLVLPIAFIPFVLNFPSGLMLYWLTTNLWTTGQGLITRRLCQDAAAAEEELADAAEEQAAASGGRGRRAGAEAGAAAPPRVRKVKRKKGGARR